MKYCGHVHWSTLFLGLRVFKNCGDTQTWLQGKCSKSIFAAFFQHYFVILLIEPITCFVCVQAIFICLIFLRHQNLVHKSLKITSLSIVPVYFKTIEVFSSQSRKSMTAKSFCLEEIVQTFLSVQTSSVLRNSENVLYVNATKFLMFSAFQN